MSTVVKLNLLRYTSKGGGGWRRRLRKDGVGECGIDNGLGGGEGCNLGVGIIGKGNTPQ